MSTLMISMLFTIVQSYSNVAESVESRLRVLFLRVDQSRVSNRVDCDVFSRCFLVCKTDEEVQNAGDNVFVVAADESFYNREFVADRDD